MFGSRSACLLSILALAGCGGEEFTTQGSGGAAGSAPTGGAGGSTSSGGSGGATACGVGTVSGVVDDFGDGVVAPQWQTYGAIVSENGGEATVEFTPNVANETAGYKSASPLQYSGCSVSGALQKVPNPEAQASAFFSVSSADALTYVETAVFQGQVRLLVKVDGLTQSEQSATYDSGEHAWLRLRDDAGTTHFEASSDGKSWVELHSAKTPSGLQQAYVDFGGASWGAHDSPGEARFDNLNRLPN